MKETMTKFFVGLFVVGSAATTAAAAGKVLHNNFSGNENAAVAASGDTALKLNQSSDAQPSRSSNADTQATITVGTIGNISVNSVASSSVSAGTSVRHSIRGVFDDNGREGEGADD